MARERKLDCCEACSLKKACGAEVGGEEVVLFILKQGFTKTTKTLPPRPRFFGSSWVFVSADFKANLGLRFLVKT